MTTGAETGLVKTVVEALLKPFAIVSTPIAERIAGWFKRKPKMFANFHPNTCIWSLGRNGDEPIMQVRFSVDLTHDDPRETLVIVDAYPEDTHSKIPFHKFTILPHQLVSETVVVFVQPVVGQQGKEWTGHIVLVDQFKRPYKLQRTSFRTAG